MLTIPQILKIWGINNCLNINNIFIQNTDIIYHLFFSFLFSRITGMSLDNMFCSRCREGFEPHEKIVNSHGELWHPQCFV